MLYMQNRDIQTKVEVGAASCSLKASQKPCCVFEPPPCVLLNCAEGKTNSRSAVGLQQNKLSEHTDVGGGENRHNLDQMQDLILL